MGFRIGGTPLCMGARVEEHRAHLEVRTKSGAAAISARVEGSHKWLNLHNTATHYRYIGVVGSRG